ncbi:MAG: lipopolysaccharide biosynthesis protein [Tidjanibacter sp.]|nr:lipopolysaccharide biosynthesis protein [Tidjanibacter sp.]
MAAELKHKVVKGVAWSTIEKVCSALLQLAVSLVLLNLLSPEDYGIMAIVAAFPAILMPLVDSGFSQALIRKSEVDDVDYSSVFYVNIAISVALYTILVALSPAIANFFDVPQFVVLAPVLYLLIPINSLSNIQNAILSRSMEFKRLSLYTLVANAVSSGVAIWMAVEGFGVWALVGQRLGVVVVKTVMLWWGSSWRPKWLFSLDRIKAMFRYGSRILLSDLVSNIYYQISNLFIGKFYTKAELGYYDRGNKIKEMPVTSTIMAVLNVTFPAFSRQKDDKPKLALNARKVFVLWAFVMLPLMGGLIFVAEDMFRALLPEVWLPAVPYLQILSIGGLLAPLSVISFNIVKVCSDGKMIFRIEFVKKLIATAVLAITIPISIRAIAWGQVAIFVSDMIVNTLAARHYVREWSLWRRIKDVVPIALATLAMLAIVSGVGHLLTGASALTVFVAKIVVGIGSYALLGELFRLEAWREMKEILVGYFPKRRK